MGSKIHTGSEYRKGPRMKSVLEQLHKEADEKGVVPLKLTTEDVEFLNKMKSIADEGRARGRLGKSEIYWGSLATIRRLTTLAGWTKEILREWEKRNRDETNKFPVTPDAAYVLLERVRRRVKAHKAHKAELEKQKEGKQNETS